jgi:hypothetical protein
MHRTGVMAPPTLDELPRRPGLMAPDPVAVPHEPSLSLLLWCAVCCLAAVELCVAVLNP